MEKGTLVEFRVNNDRRLAVIDRQEGKINWIALDERGQSHKLHPRQVTYEVGNQTFKPADIPQFLQQVQPYLDPDGLEVAWELLTEMAESAAPADMARLLFSDQSAPLCYAAHYLLSEDKLYFKQKGDRYEPRPATQVNELKHQTAMAAQRQQEWVEFCHRITLALQGEVPEWQPSDRSRLDALEKFATFGEEVAHRAPALETLAALHRPETPAAALQLLVEMGLWSSHENLFLRRSQVPIHLSAKVLEVAHHRLDFPPEDVHVDRLDLTHLKVYTIDDESTKEIDDGLSVEVLPDGHRLWIHIADPTRWLTPGDELDLEARRRTTTIYLPTGMIPMFPPELATGPMSLNPGKVACALSFGIILDELGGVKDYSIHASSIKSTYRLTYEDVDEMLELGVQAESELEVLFQAAKRRQLWRQSQGAISIHMPESSIKVTDDEIAIAVLEDSASRKLVAEMMILTGEVAARYGQTHHLPLPFRHQPQPELPPEAELMLLPAGPVRSCAIRRCMPRSELSITPARHASLGLDTYTQVTSPIRRYSDLLTHFQIKAHLRGADLPFSQTEMQELMIGISNAVYEATQVERQTNKYWGLEYLRRNAHEEWPALMLRWLREHENLGLVLLEDLGLELAMRFNRDVEPGDRLILKVSHVDPRQDIIHFQEVITPAAQHELE